MGKFAKIFRAKQQASKATKLEQRPFNRISRHQ